MTSPFSSMLKLEHARYEAGNLLQGWAASHRLHWAVLGSFVRSVFASLRRRPGSTGIARGPCGAVTFVQRFSDALNLNVHFHSLLLDGVYASGTSGAPRFHALTAAQRCRSRAGGRAGGAAHRAPPRARRSRPRGGPLEADPLAGEEPLLAELHGASVAGRIASGLAQVGARCGSVTASIPKISPRSRASAAQARAA